MIEDLTKLIGRKPDRIFSNDGFHWWADIEREIAMKAYDMGASITEVYAYPHLVEGGQRWNVCYRVK